MNEDKNYSSITLIYNLWKVLKKKTRLKVILLSILMIINSICEALFIVAVASLIEFITNNNLDSAKNISLLKPFLKLMPTSYNQNFLFYLTLVSIFIIIVSSIIRIINIYFNTRLAAEISYELSANVFKKNLYQPYLVQISKNTSDLIVTNTVQVLQVQGITNLVLNFFTSLFIIVGLLYALVSVNWKLTIFLFIIFSFFYFLIALTVRKKLNNNSKIIASYNKQQVKLIQESLGSIREIILNNSHNIFNKKFNIKEKRIRDLQGENDFLGMFPKYLLEGVGILVLASTPILAFQGQYNIKLVIPSLGTFALGAQRLLPVFQMAYASWAGIKNTSQPLKDILNALEQEVPENVSYKIHKIFDNAKKIKFESVYFNYQTDSKYVLQNINTEILKGENIGIIGTTGSGKSTFVDILMGFSSPTKGKLIIDNTEIYSKENNVFLNSWRNSISHVPQSIYLIDGTIAENISLSNIDSELDMDLIDHVCSIAQISKFIKSLPNDYNTQVGERGVKLSGGQKQRIGIARSLYKKSSLIVLDEATSALDSETEYLLMDSLFKNINKKTTLISIAHRLSSLKYCNRIIKLDKGNLISDDFKI